MSSFTKTLIVDGMGGGDPKVNNFNDVDWQNDTGCSWIIQDNSADSGNIVNTISGIHSPVATILPGFDYILKYTVIDVDGNDGELQITGPFDALPSLSKAIGVHVYRIYCQGQQRLHFTYGKENGTNTYHIELSDFSFKECGANDTYVAIKTAVDDLGIEGGSVIVEQGLYPLDGIGELTTITVPSNCSITGQGGTVISIRGNLPVFQNKDQTNGNERIEISGLSIQNDLETAYTCNALEFKDYNTPQNLDRGIRWKDLA